LRETSLFLENRIQARKCDRRFENGEIPHCKPQRLISCEKIKDSTQIISLRLR